MPLGLLYDRVPAEYIVGASSLCLIALTSYLMRSSILKEAHPELQKDLSNQPEPL